MDKEQKIKDMAQALLDTKETISSQDVAYYKSYGFKKFGCYYRMAEKLVDAGYGNVRAAVEDVAERIKMAFYYEFDELIPSIMADKIDELIEEVCGDD